MWTPVEVIAAGTSVAERLCRTSDLRGRRLRTRPTRSGQSCSASLLLRCSAVCGLRVSCRPSISAVPSIYAVADSRPLHDIRPFSGTHDVYVRPLTALSTCLVTQLSGRLVDVLPTRSRVRNPSRRSSAGRPAEGVASERNAIETELRTVASADARTRALRKQNEEIIQDEQTRSRSIAEVTSSDSLVHTF